MTRGRRVAARRGAGEGGVARGRERREGVGCGAQVDTGWAMSQENVELGWQAARAWNDGEDAFLQYLDADVEWHPPAESMEPGIYRGHDGVRDYSGRLGQIFEERHAEPLEVIDVDDENVIVVCRINARSENSGMEIHADWAWLITVGPRKKVTRVRIFTDKAQALEAAGLSE